MSSLIPKGELSRFTGLFGAHYGSPPQQFVLLLRCTGRVGVLIEAPTFLVELRVTIDRVLMPGVLVRRLLPAT